MTNYEWARGSAYEIFVGRWSRTAARAFLRWLDAPSRSKWLEVGCGTGALTSAIPATQDVRSIRAFDLSKEFVTSVLAHIKDPRAEFIEADARALPEGEASFDAAVSGLVLNFVPDPERAVAEMRRVTRPGGTVAVYVWDYANSSVNPESLLEQP